MRTFRLALSVLVVGVVCVAGLSGRRGYDMGHGVRMRALPNDHGGFLPWQFDVTTPDDHGARWLVLERDGAGQGATVILEAPLPAASTRTRVTIMPDSGRLALRVGGERRFARLEAAILRAGPSLNPHVLPQDSSGAIVLQYTVPEIGKGRLPSLAQAERLEATEFLRLRVELRPGTETALHH